MKTKLTAVLTMVLFSFTLIQIPVVSASEPIENGTGVLIPTVDASQPTQVEEVPVPSDPTAAFLSVVSVVQEIIPEETEPTPLPISVDVNVVKITEIVQMDLMSTFGFSKEMLDEAIRNGLIKIEVDLANLKAIVTMDPSIRGELTPDVAYLADLLGKNELPSQINYALGKSEGPAILAPCTISADGTADCPPQPPPTYYLKSASFQIGSDYFAKLTYLDDGFLDDEEIVPIDFVGDNQLHFVRIYNGNPHIVCITTPCPTGVLIKAIQYIYTDDPSFFQASIYYYDPAHYRDGVYDGSVLFDGTLRPINVRDNIEIKKMIDGKYHIMSIVDYFPNIGGLVAKNEFVYAIAIHPPCDPDTGCEPDKVSLVKIVRTGPNGELLSEITNIGPAIMIMIYPPPPNQKSFQATVELPNGRKVHVNFNTLEELLNEAWKVEHFRPIVPFEASASTSTDGTKNLSIKVDEFGNATVTWHNQTYYGIFDPDTKQITVPISPKFNRIQPLAMPVRLSSETSNLVYWPSSMIQTWTLQLVQSGENYSIQSFVSKTEISIYSITMNYYFNSQGLMEIQSWVSGSSTSQSVRKSAYTYITINGKILIESIISTYFFRGYDGYSSDSESESKGYYGYDQLGNLTTHVIVGSRTTRTNLKDRSNTQTTYWGSYYLIEGNKRTDVYTNGAPRELFDRVNSAKNYRLIDRFARIKTEHYFSGDPLIWQGLKFSVQYVKNNLGSFIPRYVTPNDSSNQSYIVQGRPDVLSGEKNDILIKRWQNVNDYQITYGEAYQYNILRRSVRNPVSVSSLSLAGDTVSSGNSLIYPYYQEPKYLGYGLVFSKWGQKPDGTWGQTIVVVDYPNVKKVELDGKLYHIKIDVEGNVNLIEIRPEPKIQPVPEPTVLRINNKVETILPALITPKKVEPIKSAAKLLNLPKRKK